MKLPDARTDVLAAMAGGRLATAGRDELAGVLEILTQEMLPVTMKINPVTRSKRVVGKLLDWLEQQPGGSWQERWDLWIARGEQDYRPHPGSSGKGVRQETAYAINALIMVDAVRPSYDWMLSARRIRLWRDWAAYHQPETFQLVIAQSEARGGLRDANRVVAVLAMLCIHHGKNVRDLTAEDFRGLRSVQHDRGVAYHGLPAAWTACKDAGLFSNEPSGYAELVHVAKMTPEQLVDRHGVANPDIRTVFVRYIKIGRAHV